MDATPYRWNGFEIKRLPLLSREEEITLGQRIREHRDLAARNTLVAHHMMFVFGFAKKFGKKSRTDLLDLVQWGNIGLILAANKYDERVGRFSTYARWWIEASIRESLHENSVIRLPSNVHNDNREILKAAKALAEELGRVPALAEIAARLGMSIGKVKDILSWMKMNIVSLDDRLTNGDLQDATIGSVLPDQSILRPDLFVQAQDELAAAQQRISNVRYRLGNGLRLSKRDQTLFKLFHGLDCRRRYSLEELVDATGNTISKQRIQQVLAHVWERLGVQGARPNKNPLLDDLERIKILEELVQPYATCAP